VVFLREPGMLSDITQVKILLLYVLSYFNAPVSQDSLNETLFSSALVEFFDMTTALSEMEETGHVNCVTNEKGTFYSCTPLGLEAIILFQNHLPYSVREKAVRLASDTWSEMKKDSQVTAKYEKISGDRYGVTLSYHDDGESIISVSIAAPSLDEAKKICARFKENTAQICSAIIKTLTTD
jgi:hypothetical protein